MEYKYKFPQIIKIYFCFYRTRKHVIFGCWLPCEFFSTMHVMNNIHLLSCSHWNIFWAILILYMSTQLTSLTTIVAWPALGRNLPFLQWTETDSERLIRIHCKGVVFYHNPAFIFATILYIQQRINFKSWMLKVACSLTPNDLHAHRSAGLFHSSPDFRVLIGGTQARKLFTTYKYKRHFQSRNKMDYIEFA